MFDVIWRWCACDVAFVIRRNCAQGTESMNPSVEVDGEKITLQPIALKGRVFMEQIGEAVWAMYLS